MFFKGVELIKEKLKEIIVGIFELFQYGRFFFFGFGGHALPYGVTRHNRSQSESKRCINGKFLSGGNRLPAGLVVVIDIEIWILRSRKPLSIQSQELAGFVPKTPLTPLEWAESLRESAPHLWPRASGTFAPGGGGGKAAFKRSEMTSEQKRDFQRKHGQTAYLALPK